MNEVAKRLRALMKERRISQEELGRRVGKSQSAVKHWLAHDGPPTRLIPAVEDALDAPPGTLLGRFAGPSGPLAQELIGLLQAGAFSEDELAALLAFCRTFGKAMDVREGSAAQASLRPVLRAAPPVAIAPSLGLSGTVWLVAPGKAAASPAGRDWFDTLDEPPRQAVDPDRLHWLTTRQKLDPARHYLLQVEGASMSPLIPEDALCVVAHQETPVSHLPNVVAWQEGGEGRVAVKYVRHENGRLLLQSEHPDYPPLALTPANNPMIRGHVIALAPEAG